MNTLEASPLVSLQNMLQRIHPGAIEADEFLLPWFQNGALEFFLEHAEEITPRLIFFGVGEPLRCHKAALETSVMFPRCKPFFGFRLSYTDAGRIWWLHSWTVTPTGSLLDPGPETRGARYVGLRWSKQLHERLPRLNWN